MPSSKQKSIISINFHNVTHLGKARVKRSLAFLSATCITTFQMTLKRGVLKLGLLFNHPEADHNESRGP